MNKTSIENVHLLIFHIKIHLTVLYCGCFTNTYIQFPRTGSNTLNTNYNSNVTSRTFPLLKLETF